MTRCRPPALSNLARGVLVIERGGTLELGRWCEVVVTRDGTAGRALLRSMDHAQAGGCGPVVAHPQRRHLVWLVPPGTVDTWPGGHGVCFGRSGRIRVPPRSRTAPPGAHWVRPLRRGLVDPAALHRGIEVAYLGEPPPAVADLLPDHCCTPA